jgi:hemerythrin-like domain-containing protein
MKITDSLLGEHGLFWQLFSLLEGVAESANSMLEIQHAVAWMRPILRTHAAAEEQLVIAPLEARGASGRSVAVLRGEHNDIDELLADVAAHQDVKTARPALLQTIAVLRGHFAKEEAILFPLAEALMTESELHALGARWAAARKVLLLPPSSLRNSQVVPNA